MLRMTTLNEYVEYGVNREIFKEMLETSVRSLENHKPLPYGATVEVCKKNLIYIGIPNKSTYEDDGSSFGKQIKKAGEPLYLFRLRASPDTMGYVFRRMDNNTPWYTGNGNATLSPWDANKLLHQYNGITFRTTVKKQGNSLVLIMTDEIRKIDADVGDEVSVTISR